MSEPEEITIRIRRDIGESPVLFVDFGPRVHFTTDLANARKLINALESAIWEAVYPKTSSVPIVPSDFTETA